MKIPTILFLSLRAACKQMGPSRLKMRGHHSNHSHTFGLFSVKWYAEGAIVLFHLPSVWLAASMFGALALPSVKRIPWEGGRLGGLRRYFTKQSTICWPLPGWQLKGRGSLAGLTSRPKQDVCVIKSRWWRPSTHLYTERSSLYTSTAGFLCCFDLKEIAHPKWQLCHYLLMLMLFQTYLLLFFSETFNRDA